MELDVRYFYKMKMFFAVNQVVYARGRSSVEKCLAGGLCFCQSFVSSAVLSHKKNEYRRRWCEQNLKFCFARTSERKILSGLSANMSDPSLHVLIFLYCDTGRLTRSDRNTALPGIHSVHGTPLTRDVLGAWRNYPCPRSQY